MNLLNHEKTHNIQNRNYNCSQCEKSFFEKSHLLRHQNFHSQSRNYKCEICEKFYKTERCLKVHKQVHSEHRPFKCSVCQKGFLSSSKLKQHANIHSNLRPYKVNLIFMLKYKFSQPIFFSANTARGTLRSKYQVDSSRLFFIVGLIYIFQSF